MPSGRLQHQAEHAHSTRGRRAEESPLRPPESRGRTGSSHSHGHGRQRSCPRRLDLRQAPAFFSGESQAREGVAFGESQARW